VSHAARPRPVATLFWRLYIVVGIISTAVGILLLCLPDAVVHGGATERNMTRAVGAIFVVFGIVRAFVAIARLRRLSRS
jgi:uncharacterized membrane protein HdeD (DUF308 family)